MDDAENQGNEVDDEAVQDRYKADFEAPGGIMDKRQLTEAMTAVSQPEQEGKRLGTAWTMVMDLAHPSVTYYSRRHFDRPFHFDFASEI